MFYYFPIYILSFASMTCLKDIFFLHWITLGTCRTSSDFMWGSCSGLSILFYWSIFLSLGQYHTVLIGVALQYILRSDNICVPNYILIQYYFRYSRFLAFPYIFKKKFVNFYQKYLLRFWLRLNWMNL